MCGSRAAPYTFATSPATLTRDAVVEVRGARGSGNITAPRRRT